MTRPSAQTNGDLTESPPSPKKSRISYSAIVSDLRGRIIRGDLLAGSQVPNRKELVRQFGASSVTIQRAVNRLVSDGFLYTDGPNGTFVTEHPPHQSRYGLLLTSHAGNQQAWRRFSSVLCNSARNLRSAPSKTIAIYYDIDGRAQSEDYQKLIRDLRTHRLAGLIIAGEPDRLFGTPVLAPGAPPRVALMEEPAGPDTAVVGHDRYAFIDRALDYLQAQGRTNIAFLAGERVAPHNIQQYLVSSLAGRGMHHESYWWQRTFVGEAHLMRNVVCLLMHERQQVRPDGLIIYDDNLIEPVIGGLMDMGVQVPTDVDLVAHTNFPWTSPTVVPLKRVGYDAGQTLELCIELIDRQRRGETVEMMTLVQPIEEYESSEASMQATT